MTTQTLNMSCHLLRNCAKRYWG